MPLRDQDSQVSSGDRSASRALGKLENSDELVPDGVMYDRVAVLQIAALRKRVEELEAEIKAVRNAPN